MLNILIKGSGVAGLTIGWELSKYNYNITIYTPQESLQKAASWFAGGMLAPFCERENAPALIQEEGIKSLSWWQTNFGEHIYNNGTLVLALNRDLPELERFANFTTNYEKLNKSEIQALEPDLNFDRALFYKKEAHLDPRKILLFIQQKLKNYGAIFTTELPNKADFIIDCTGIDRAKHNKNLRGVRGEMLFIKCKGISLKRNIRLLHPRIPLYVVPREDNIFMVGATMIESANDAPILCRSLMEMLNAIYSLHPAFASAQLLESGVAIRPAFIDNLPKMEVNGKYIFINGLYRHGFLLAPYMAKNVLKLIKNKEV